MPADNEVTNQGGGRFFSNGLAKMVQLLRYLAGDPSLSDRAVYLAAPQAVTDALAVGIDEAQDESQEFSIAELHFTSASNLAYYDPTGGTPKNDGTRGVEIPSGAILTIRGVWNVRKFRVIAASGGAATFTAVLFKTSLWSSGLMKEQG